MTSHGECAGLGKGQWKEEDFANFWDHYNIAQKWIGIEVYKIFCFGFFIFRQGHVKWRGNIGTMYVLIMMLHKAVKACKVFLILI